MKRVAAYMCLPLERLNIYIVYNMLMVNLPDSRQSFTRFQRVERHGINLDTLRQASHLSCEAQRTGYSLDYYERQLSQIACQRRNYSPWQVAVGGGLACGGFCIQFGCDWTAFFYAALAAILGLRLRMWLGAVGSNALVNTGVAAFVSTLIAWAFSELSQWATASDGAMGIFASSTPWHPLLACALFIVPGVPLINFVSDMLSGYTQVGVTRAPGRRDSGNGNADDAPRHGFRHCLCHSGVWHRQLCQGPADDSPSCLRRVFACSRRIGHRLLHDIQHAAPSDGLCGTGRCRQRLHAQLRQPRTLQRQHRA